MGFVAAEGGTSECTSQTIVGGTIYQEDITNPIANANVVVTCNTATKEVTSKVMEVTLLYLIALNVTMVIVLK